MRMVSRSIAAAGFIVGLLVVPGSWATPASAQCGMMGGHGSDSHDHGASRDSGAKKRAASAKKQRQSVDRLLSDEQGRQVLADALLADREFMRSLVAQLLETPEWRALLSQGLSQAPTDRMPPAKSDQAVAVYTCPMHPDVTSSEAGDCPRCGMELVRRAVPDQSR